MLFTPAVHIFVLIYLCYFSVTSQFCVLNCPCIARHFIVKINVA